MVPISIRCWYIKVVDTSYLYVCNFWICLASMRYAATFWDVVIFCSQELKISCWKRSQIFLYTHHLFMRSQHLKTFNKYQLYLMHFVIICRFYVSNIRIWYLWIRKKLVLHLLHNIVIIFSLFLLNSRHPLKFYEIHVMFWNMRHSFFWFATFRQINIGYIEFIGNTSNQIQYWFNINVILKMLWTGTVKGTLV